MIRSMSVLLVVVGLLIGGTCLAGVGPPIPVGPSSAINGAEDFFAGAFPPPGFYLINYVLYYNAHRIMDGRGGEIAGPSGATFTKQKVEVMADVIRPIYVSDIEIFGGNAAWHLVVPVVTGRGEVGWADKSDGGIGDIFFSPLIIGWHPSETLHYAAGLDVIAPTARYNENDLFHFGGSDHWTLEPAFAITKLFPDCGLQLDAKLMYDHHIGRAQTVNALGMPYKVETGDQFHMDYNIGYHINNEWAAGIAGYYLQSTERDKVDGNSQHRSGQRVVAVGPVVRWAMSQTTQLSLKVLWETAAINRPEGVAAWFKVVHAFGK